jgi:hypothetical protein
LSTKIEQLQWRRSKVVEMRARGMSQARRDLDKNLFESKMRISREYAMTIVDYVLTLRSEINLTDSKGLP